MHTARTIRILMPMLAEAFFSTSDMTMSHIVSVTKCTQYNPCVIKKPMNILLLLYTQQHSLKCSVKD